MAQDLFSGHAGAYAKARPTYPPSLFQALADLAPGRTLAWDCATGNGQAALPLAEHFEAVRATDLSPQQLQEAPRHSRITYALGREDESGLEPGTADLVTVAQAYHWFDRDRFHGEVRRVLRPRGLVAIWCYERLQVGLEVDAVIDRLYRQVLEGWWSPERALVETGYTTLPFPFDPVAMPSLAIEGVWSLGNLVAYLETWSALQKKWRATGQNPLDEVRGELEGAWGGDAPKPIRFPLSLKVGRV